MSLRNTFRRWFQGRTAQPVVRKSRSYRLVIEPLEDRTLLTHVSATFINHSGFPLVFDDQDTQAAIANYTAGGTNNELVEVDPPETIQNGQQGTFSMDGTFSGIEGDFYFFVGNTGVKDDVFMDNPFVGSNTYTQTFTPNNGYFTSNISGGGGVNASVTYTISSIGGNLGAWGNVTAGPAAIFGSPETIPGSDGAMNMLLLPNGNVMIHGAGDTGFGDNASANWYLLQPDGNGSYSGNNVQITTLQAMSTGRRFLATDVLPNDTVFAYGGEYSFTKLSGNTTSGSAVVTGLSSTNQLVPGMQVTGSGLQTPSITATGTAGSNTFTGVSSTMNLFVGMVVASGGLAGATITGINVGASTINLSQAPAASGGVTFQFTDAIATVDSASQVTLVAPATATASNVQLSFFGQDEIDTGESFNPATNTWTPIAKIPAALDTSGQFGDQNTVLVSNNQLLAADPQSQNAFLWSIPGNAANDGTAAWTATGSMRVTTDNEDNWTLLPNGDVLDYEIKLSDQQANAVAQIYVPSGNTIPANDGGGVSAGGWYNASSGAIQLTAGGATGPTDMGPAVLVPFYAPFNGPAALYIGWNGSTAYYNPANNTWSAGPNEPTYMGNQMSSADGPAAVLPDGEVLVALSPQANPATPGFNFYAGPTRIYLLNPATGVFTDVTPPDANLNGTGNGSNAFDESMLELPSGQILMSDTSSTLWIYTPTGATATPIAGSQPTVTSVAPDPNNPGEFLIQGTGLNGLDEGAYYGDDEQMSTNYPIVQLKTSTGGIITATSSNWQTGVVAGGTSVDITLPSGANPNLLTTLSVVANGISSAPFALGGITLVGGALTIQVNPLVPAPHQISIVGTAGGGLQATVDGQSQTFTAGQVTSIAVIGGGTNTLTLDFSQGNFIPAGGLSYDGGPQNGGTLNLQGGSFTNEVDTPSGPHAGTVTLDGSVITYKDLTPIFDTVTATNDTINGTGAAGESINIVNDPAGSENGFTSAEVNGSDFEKVDFANKTNVNVKGLNSNNTITVDNATAAAGLTHLNVSDGTGADVWNVQAIPGGGVVTTLISNGPGVNTVNVSSNAPTDTGTLAGIAGKTLYLQFMGTRANQSMNISESGLTTADNVTVNTGPGFISSSTLGWTIDQSNSFVFGGGVTLSLGSGGNTVAVSSVVGSSGGEPFTLNSGTGADSVNVTGASNGGVAAPLTINGQDGADTVTIGSLAPATTGGTLSGIDAPISITNAFDFSSVIIDDSGDTTANETATLGTTTAAAKSFGKLTGLDMPAAGSISWRINNGGGFSDISSATVNGGTGGTTFTVSQTAAAGTGAAGAAVAEIINGAGLDTLNVKTTSMGVVTSWVGGAFATVNITNAGSVQGILGALNLENPPAHNTVIVDDSADTAARTATLSEFSPNASAPSEQAGLWGKIHGLAPADINFDTNDTTNINLKGATGKSNTLVGPNLAATWNLTGANAGAIVAFPSPVSLTFIAFANLTGGAVQNVFTFVNTASLTGVINGGTNPKVDWLDYSAIASNVVVNLATGTATRVGGGVKFLDDVIGSKNGGDHLTGNAAGGVLVGHNAGNLITAGAGPTVIIGGYGLNTLIGGASGDLLLNGRTTFDANYVNLELFLTVWQSAATYPTRIATEQTDGLTAAHIFVYPGINGGVGPRVGRGGAGYESTLLGNGGQDWFITNALNSIADKQSNEIATIL